MAVGQYVAASGGLVTLAERWNGASWSISPTVNPSGSFIDILTGVSCLGTDCMAVGNYGTVSRGVVATLPLTERWNARAWSVVPAPTPAGGSGAKFNGVSCLGVSKCWAVGGYTASNVARTLAESWNGAAWSVVSSPNP
jgi:hypothetical protein